MFYVQQTSGNATGLWENGLSLHLHMVNWITINSLSIYLQPLWTLAAFSVS
jgi:hypothetical protein